MIEPAIFRLAARRFLLILAVSTLLVWIGSEIAHQFVKSPFDRPPQTLNLTIPAGTAIRVAAGVEEPGIPDEMDFVVGDTLIVYNDDTVPHELGPLYVPAGASASLKMEESAQEEVSCSFRTTQILGLTVHEATTLNIRLVAVGYVSPATAIVLFLYSLALYPLRPKNPTE